MRYLPRALLAAGLGLAASLVVACGGGSGLLSTDQASSLKSQLAQISSRVSSGDCSGAASAINTFSNEVANLTGVSATLRDNLAQDAAKVGQLAAAQCGTTTPTTTTPTTGTSTTTTTPTNTSTTTSTPTQTTTPSTAPATTPTSPGTTSTSTGSGGTGIGNGNGNGTGGGNGGSGGVGAGNG